MISFSISIFVLLLGFIFYSGFVERIEGINPGHQTPAYKLEDDVDFVPMPLWRVFLMMFITIVCGAISGFHATQSPLMARCITNEKPGRKVFYLTQERKLYWVTLVPAVFMTAVTSTYLHFAPEGFSLSMGVSHSIGIAISIISPGAFLKYRKSIIK